MRSLGRLSSSVSTSAMTTSSPPEKGGYSSAVMYVVEQNIGTTSPQMSSRGEGGWHPGLMTGAFLRRGDSAIKVQEGDNVQHTGQLPRIEALSASILLLHLPASQNLANSPHPILVDTCKTTSTLQRRLTTLPIRPIEHVLHPLRLALGPHALALRVPHAGAVESGRVVLLVTVEYYGVFDRAKCFVYCLVELLWRHDEGLGVEVGLFGGSDRGKLGGRGRVLAEEIWVEPGGGGREPLVFSLRPVEEGFTLPLVLGGPLGAESLFSVFPCAKRCQSLPQIAPPHVAHLVLPFLSAALLHAAFLWGLDIARDGKTTFDKLAVRDSLLRRFGDVNVAGVLGSDCQDLRRGGEGAVGALGAAPATKRRREGGAGRHCGPAVESRLGGSCSAVRYTPSDGRCCTAEMAGVMDA
ncbi:hypothetical protein KC344_g32 [Hortaea werneckii]|nr:hypothetical protein KC344_g32 [Hortaea werneckii]